MAAPIDIQRAGVDQSEEAFRLLGRFFREEGFDTPPEEMRSSLGAMIAGPASAVFVARRGGAAGGVATVSTSVGIEYGKSAEMDDLYVLPRGARQRRGCCTAGSSLQLVQRAGGRRRAGHGHARGGGSTPVGRLLPEAGLRPHGTGDPGTAAGTWSTPRRWRRRRRQESGLASVVVDMAGRRTRAAGQRYGRDHRHG